MFTFSINICPFQNPHTSLSSTIMNSFIYSVIKHFLHARSMPGTVLGPGDARRNTIWCLYSGKVQHSERRAYVWIWCCCGLEMNLWGRTITPTGCVCGGVDSEGFPEHIVTEMISKGEWELEGFGDLKGRTFQEMSQRLWSVRAPTKNYAECQPWVWESWYLKQKETEPVRKALY